MTTARTGAGPLGLAVVLAVVLAMVLAVILAACGASVSPPTLEGREFLSTSVLDSGRERPLVAGTRMRLSFQDGRLGASAGCNLMGGEYRLDGGRLVLAAAAMTEMGCDPERHAQDDWLFRLLSARPAVALAGDELRLDAGDIVIRLIDREVAEPDLPLVGPTWTVEAIVSGDVVSSVPGGVVATLRFGPDGRVEIDTACNQGGARVASDERSLRFEDISLTKRACPGPAGEMEAAMLAVLRSGPLAYSVDAQTLELGGGGQGLILRGR